MWLPLKEQVGGPGLWVDAGWTCILAEPFLGASVGCFLNQGTQEAGGLLAKTLASLRAGGPQPKKRGCWLFLQLDN